MGNCDTELVVYNPGRDKLCLDKLTFVSSKPIASFIAEAEPSIGIETGDYV